MNRVIRAAVTALVLVLLSARGNGGETNTIIAAHAGDLVFLQGDKLAPFAPDKFLRAPTTILYFGAGWCPDCRKFSPTLVSAYKAQTGDKKFEVLFISKDKTEEAMVKFMKNESMTWPALAFSKIAGAEDLNKFYSGKGIPCLTIIDRNGRILNQSNSDQDAAKVLSSLSQFPRK